MKRIILRGGALLELDQVRHVLAVVKYRTFLEASFQLNRSQSSLSKSIRPVSYTHLTLPTNREV